MESDSNITRLVTQALPLLLRYRQFSWDYDDEADVLYVTFEKAAASDSDLAEEDDDIVLRFSGDRIIGVTVLNASAHGMPLVAK